VCLVGKHRRLKYRKEHLVIQNITVPYNFELDKLPITKLTYRPHGYWELPYDNNQLLKTLEAN
jgi:hypothetical protein